MNNLQPYPTTDEAFLLPRLIRLGKNLYGAAFFLMKLLPARFILDWCTIRTAGSKAGATWSRQQPHSKKPGAFSL